MDLKPPPTVLQFAATMVSKNKSDRIREFVVNYYVDDRSFSVFETVVPNSGFRGGKFLQKKMCLKPETNKPYEPHDIFIGARITLDGWVFVLQEASEHTLKVMEARSDVFVKCDLSLAMSKMRTMFRDKIPSLRAAFEKVDERKKLRVSLLETQQILKDYGIIMGDQEFLTLFRRYQFGDSDKFAYLDFLKAME